MVSLKSKYILLGEFCLREIWKSFRTSIINNFKMTKELSQFTSLFPNDFVFRPVSIKCGSWDTRYCNDFYIVRIASLEFLRNDT